MRERAPKGGTELFGYVTVDPATLPKEALERYRGFYCGLCRTLKKRHGDLSRATLSNDMTFLLILLNSLYEPEETVTESLCALRPGKVRSLETEFSGYVADMNVVLAYHKCMDNWEDDHSPAGLLQARLLREAYGRAKKTYPDKCGAIADTLRRIGELEKQNAPADSLANETGRMLGEIYAARGDYWAGTLRTMGEALGRFIYLMDAYEDLPADLRRKRFNPLVALRREEQYELVCKDSLSMLIAEATGAYELLPLQKDVDILRNILYAGIWTRYARIRDKRERAQRDKLKRAGADT